MYGRLFLQSSSAFTNAFKNKSCFLSLFKHGSTNNLAQYTFTSKATAVSSSHHKVQQPFFEISFINQYFLPFN